MALSGVEGGAGWSENANVWIEYSCNTIFWFDRRHWSSNRAAAQIVKITSRRKDPPFPLLLHIVARAEEISMILQGIYWSCVRIVVQWFNRVARVKWRLRGLKILDWQVYTVRKIEKSIKLIIYQNLLKVELIGFFSILWSVPVNSRNMLIYSKLKL
jgi:hypothetical protein